MTPATRDALSLTTLNTIARGLRRDGYAGGTAWRGVLRQMHHYAAELRWRSRFEGASR